MTIHPTARESSTPAVHVLHDNEDWLPPFRRAFERAGVPLVAWPLHDLTLDLDAAPPEGVFWSRLSASSHTRGAPFAKEFARAALGWLESWDRRVVNGSAVTEIEVSKVRQHAALRRAGLDVPRTLAVHGAEHLLAAADDLPAPFLTKHNQGGKGLGVRRFETHADFARAVRDGDLDEAADGITLLQELLATPEPFITRAEFVGGRFVYAVRVDTSGDAFQLCPADACALPGQHAMFERNPAVTAEDPLVRRYEALLADLGIEIAGIEFLTTADGRTVTYDVNTNTNYNSDVEAEAPESAADRIAAFLGAELAARTPQRVRSAA